MGTIKNSVIRSLQPDSAEGKKGNTHSVSCKLCGELMHGNSVRFLADWIKAHHCEIPAAQRPPVD